MQGYVVGIEEVQDSRLTIASSLVGRRTWETSSVYIPSLPSMRTRRRGTNPKTKVQDLVVILQTDESSSVSHFIHMRRM